MTRRPLLAALLVVALPALSPRAARAEDDGNSAETAAARAIALEGIKLADAGRCPEALDKLTRAERLHHAPVVLGRLGECQVAIGKLVDGTETLRKVLREPLPANAPAVVVKARERAQGVLDAAKPRIGATIISVKGPRDNAAVTVTFDGQPMPVALLDAERPTDPGEHFVEASAIGFLKGVARVGVNAGDRQTVTIRLDPDPNAVRALAQPITSDPSTAPRPFSADATLTSSETSRDLTSEGPSHAAAYVAFIAGGASLVAGSIVGAIAIKDKRDLEGECPANVCPESSQDRLDSARRASTISNVLFGVGGAGLVIGTVLYLTASSPAPAVGARASAEPEQPREQAMRARAWIGLGQAGITGEF